MVGFNVANFRANGLVRGGARPTLFTVTLTFPDVATALHPNVESRIQFLCRAADLPNDTINKVPIPYFGRKIQVAGDREYVDWRCTIMNDEDFAVKDSLEAWHNAINSIIGNRLNEEVAGINPQLNNSYKTDGMITQFAKTGPGEIDGVGAIKTYKFTGMFPIEIDSIRVDWNDTDAIEEFNVTWAYDWWEPYIRADDQPIFDLEGVDSGIGGVQVIP